MSAYRCKWTSHFTLRLKRKLVLPGTNTQTNNQKNEQENKGQCGDCSSNDGILVTQPCCCRIWRRQMKMWSNKSRVPDQNGVSRSTINHAWDTPFWSGTLEMLCLLQWWSNKCLFSLQNYIFVCLLKVSIIVSIFFLAGCGSKENSHDNSLIRKSDADFCYQYIIILLTCHICIWKHFIN